MSHFLVTGKIRQFLIVGVCALAGFGVSVNSATGQEAQNRKDFVAHLHAGEFGPARDIALGQPAPQQRDNLLGEMAKFQAERGSLDASINTIALMQNDQARSGSLGSMGSFDSLRSPGTEGLSGGQRGGGSQADFDPLIELITTTVAPDSWDEVGGPGSMSEFASGVYVDPTGTLKLLKTTAGSDALSKLRTRSSDRSEGSFVKTESRLRKISLNRLEKEMQLLRSLGKSPDAAMKNLAGMTKVQYVFVYSETGDVVIAGPAGDWESNEEGRSVSTNNGAPILQLDDLVVCLRNALEEDGKFGCSIDPRKENLEATQRFLATSNLRGARFRNELRSTLGKQDISVHGIDASSRVAGVIVEADYRMKLVGMGLEPGVLGVESYLERVVLDGAGNPPPTDVVRWWFTLNYDAITTTEPRDGYQLNGPGVKVQSESEFLTETGERKHTGRSSGPTAAFADGFTKHFNKMAATYPVYSELRNVFDLALVSSLIRSEGLADQVDWHLTYFGSPTDSNSVTYQVEQREISKQVDTIMNHRLIEHRKNGKLSRTSVIGVSGGVVADFSQLTAPNSIENDQYGLMKNEREVAQPKNSGVNWWWD